MLNDLKAALRAGVNAFVSEWKNGAERRAFEAERKRMLSEALAGLGEARTYVETIIDRAPQLEIDDISLKRFFEALNGKPVTSQVAAVMALLRADTKLIRRPVMYAWASRHTHVIAALPQFNKQEAA